MSRTPRETNVPDPIRVSFVGMGPALTALRRELTRAAFAAGPLLLCGEAGSGKSHAAREVHRASPSGDAPFLAARCEAPPDELERELWGREGPRGQRGLWTMAGAGSLLLEDVDRLDARLQERLLGALESPAAPSRARLVATTREDLEALAAAGRFSRELCDLLAAQRVELPPLRERGDDVELLMTQLWARRAPDRDLKLTARARARVLSYAWPGNVWELAEEVARWADLEVKKISARHLPRHLR